MYTQSRIVQRTLNNVNTIADYLCVFSYFVKMEFKERQSHIAQRILNSVNTVDIDRRTFCGVGMMEF